MRAEPRPVDIWQLPKQAESHHDRHCRQQTSVLIRGSLVLLGIDSYTPVEERMCRAHKFIIHTTLIATCTVRISLEGAVYPRSRASRWRAGRPKIMKRHQSVPSDAFHQHLSALRVDRVGSSACRTLGGEAVHPATKP